MKKNLLIVFFITVLVPRLFSLNSENKPNYKSIEIYRDSINHKTILKLIIDHVKTDSITINNVDFTYDCFVKMNDSAWHYIYSKYPTYRCSELYNQLMIGTHFNKLNILLPGIYLYAWNPCKDMPVYDSLIKKMVPVMMSSTNEMKISCSRWEKEIVGNTVKIDSFNTEIHLCLALEEQIYYTTIVTLDSLYLFYPHKISGGPPTYMYEPEESEENHIRFSHQQVYAVEVPDQMYSFSYFYFKNQWFTLNRGCDRCIHPLEDVEIRFRDSPPNQGEPPKSK